MNDVAVQYDICGEKFVGTITALQKGYVKKFHTLKWLTTGIIAGLRTFQRKCVFFIKNVDQNYPYKDRGTFFYTNGIEIHKIQGLQKQNLRVKYMCHCTSDTNYVFHT